MSQNDSYLKTDFYNPALRCRYSYAVSHLELSGVSILILSTLVNRFKSY